MEKAILLTILLPFVIIPTAAAPGLLSGDTPAWLKRGDKLSSRRFVMEDMQPVPARGTCRLSWYIPTAPSVGSAVLCSGADDACLQRCSSGYDKIADSGICIQKCPDAAAGPAHLCPVSRTCIKGDGTCPLLSDVPYLCTAADQYLGSCVKQTYQAIVASEKVLNVTCENGLILQDHTGVWRCMEAPDTSPCSPGFSSDGELQGAIGAHCQQVCPPWLVDCGDTCNMPGVACNSPTEQLCPVVPLTACDMAQLTNKALQSACQTAGGWDVAVCPLALTMHGSCGGQRLQVAAGLGKGGFLHKIEAWWGPSNAGQAWQSTADGPLIAVRLSFTGDTDPVVFGNESHTYASSPRLAFSLDPSEMVVSSRLWSSTTVMEGSQLTPVLAGFDLFTVLRNLRVAGGEASSPSLADARAITAMQQRQQSASLAGGQLGVGLPVGAAAYTSESGIHAFGFLFLSRIVRQEL